jgi:glycosyltransferase involved in cell wall biosynthesis
LLTAADVYCQPNTSADSFGLSFVEALGSGLPVITSRLGGAPEIIDGTCGILLQAGDLGALTDALVRLIEHDDERRTLAAGAFTRARAFCDVHGSIARLAAQLAPLEAASLALS